MATGRRLVTESEFREGLRSLEAGLLRKMAIENVRSKVDNEERIDRTDQRLKQFEAWITGMLESSVGQQRDMKNTLLVFGDIFAVHDSRLKTLEGGSH